MRETSKHLEAFEAFYAAGRNFTKVSNQVTVSRKSLYHWADAFNWHERADGRDAETQRIVDAESAKERAERQKRRRRAAELLTARGVEFLSNFKIETARDAIQAIKIGLEMERREDALPDWVLLILGAPSDELESMGKLLGFAPGGEYQQSGEFDGDPALDELFRAP